MRIQISVIAACSFLRGHGRLIEKENEDMENFRNSVSRTWHMAKFNFSFSRTIVKIVIQVHSTQLQNVATLYIYLEQISIYSFHFSWPRRSFGVWLEHRSELHDLIRIYVCRMHIWHVHATSSLIHSSHTVISRFLRFSSHSTEKFWWCHHNHYRLTIVWHFHCHWIWLSQTKASLSSLVIDGQHPL